MRVNCLYFVAAVLSQGITGALAHPLSSSSDSSDSSDTLDTSDASAKTLEVRANAPAPLVLYPVVVDGDCAKKLDARDTTPDEEVKSMLGFRSSASFLWGSQVPSENTNKHFLLAEMTLHTADGQWIVAMERLMKITEEAKCTSASGGTEKIELTFTSEKAFELATSAWGWTNEKESHEFLMIASPVLDSSCGDDRGNRLVYNINKVSYSKSDKKATLTGKQLPWKTIAQKFELEYGKKAVDSGQTVCVPEGRARPEESDGATRYDRTFSVPLDFKAPSVLFEENYNNATTQFKLGVHCNLCAVSGSLDITGHLHVDGLKATKVAIELQPRDVKAVLDLSVDATAVKLGPKGSLTYNKDILSLQLAGISIPGVFELSLPKLGLEAGYWTSLKGKGKLGFGITSSIPNDATVSADFLDHAKIRAANWDTSTFRKNVDVTYGGDAQLTADLDVHLAPKLSLGISALEGVIDYEAALRLVPGKAQAKLEAQANTKGGVCNNPQYKFGVEFDVSVNAALDLRVGEAEGKNRVTKYEKTLWKKNKSLYNKCIGLGKSASTSTSEDAS